MPPTDQTPSPDAVLHLAALHTLAATGFASTSQAASMTLSSVMAKYLRLVSTACVERASLAGRSKVAAVDVVDALDELGVQVGELYDWAQGEGQVSFEKEGLVGLENYVNQGLAVDEGIAHLKLVPKAELDDEEETISEDVTMDEDVHVKTESEQDLEVEEKVTGFVYRPSSPDLSWLPPMPTSDHTTSCQPTEPSSSTETTADTPATASAPPQSVADRYRRPISYASSQLSQSHPFVDPPRPSITTPLPPAPSSLSNLIDTYQAIAQDPSVALRQTDLRRQATDLLRNFIAPVDSFSPKDTLVTPIPPVRATPIVPSHSDVLPQKLLPVNPRPTGILSSLVHQIQSPHLPPPLRERLTSLRPPIAQVRDGNPILYGEPVRGPDDAALLKAIGKHVDVEGEGNAQAYAYLQQTWDSGPKGVEKFSKGRLPTGKKVIMSKEGESVPRMSEETKREREEAQKVKLRLPIVGGGLSPGAATMPTTVGGGGGGGTGEGTNGSVSPGGGMVMKIKLAAPKKDQGQSVSPAPTTSNIVPNQGRNASEESRFTTKDNESSVNSGVGASDNVEMKPFLNGTSS
ncbi:hypothetical protein IAR55_005764 [Kwoniella newhampshirensis]|uniref:Bromodomain associated domain-containing protein n=1 Tax=Kwoniella newhampshirensis TaxID=1651941 RepID=A0AAW0YVK7_9TREE